MSLTSLLHTAVYHLTVLDTVTANTCSCRGIVQTLQNTTTKIFAITNNRKYFLHVLVSALMNSRMFCTQGDSVFKQSNDRKS